MKHIVYLTPNAPELGGNGALHGLERSASTSPRETLESLRGRSDEEVLIFDTPAKFAEAFNNELISDQGYILIIDDNISDHQHILDLIKEDCIAVGVECRKDDRTQYVIDLLPNNNLDYDEAKAAQDALCPELPVYMVASNRDGDWFEEKVRRVRCFADGQPEFQLESGYWLDCTEPFVENLVSLEYILKKLCPDDVKEFHQKWYND